MIDWYTPDIIAARAMPTPIENPQPFQRGGTPPNPGGDSEPFQRGGVIAPNPVVNPQPFIRGGIAPLQGMGGNNGFVRGGRVDPINGQGYPVTAGVIRSQTPNPFQVPTTPLNAGTTPFPPGANTDDTRSPLTMLLHWMHRQLPIATVPVTSDVADYPSIQSSVL